MRLYDLCYSERALLNIALRRAKISRIEDLNDPFELLRLTSQYFACRHKYFALPVA